MERRELVSTGMYTEKQADLNMERCAEFMARMIQKYGAEILEELESVFFLIPADRKSVV